MKSLWSQPLKPLPQSPSVWRVWIEMTGFMEPQQTTRRSPSVWRVWIEMVSIGMSVSVYVRSPSVWRVWIEISPRPVVLEHCLVTLRVEGVD